MDVFFLADGSILGILLYHHSPFLQILFGLYLCLLEIDDVLRVKDDLSSLGQIIPLYWDFFNFLDYFRNSDCLQSDLGDDLLDIGA